MSLPSKYTLPGFFLTIFLGAAILGPILYYLLAALWPVPFHRAMDRALLISAVTALGLVASRVPLGLLWPRNHQAVLDLLLGYLIAAVTVQAMIGFNLAFVGFTSTDLTTAQIWSRVLLAVVAALLIPPLEETIFRGFLQGELIKGLGWRAGWIIAAAIYTLAHFLKVPVSIDQEPVHLWSGLTALGAAFQPLANGDFLGGRGFNLFLIGLILGGIYLRSGSLWLNAGLHSGWVLALILFSGFTQPSPNPPVAFLAGDLLSSPLTSMVLLLLSFWLWRFYRHPSIVPETGENAP